MKFKYFATNWWGNKIYKNENGTPIVDLEQDGFYSLTDPNDIDSEPCSKLKSELIEIVEDFEND